MGVGDVDVDALGALVELLEVQAVLGGGEEGGGGGRLWEVAKSKERVKAKLEGGTKRNRGRMLGEALGEGNRFAAGWMEYFRLPAAKTWLSETEGWLGRRLRCYRRKECKRRIGVIHAT